MNMMAVGSMEEYCRLVSNRKFVNNGFTFQETAKYIEKSRLFCLPGDYPVFLYDDDTCYEVCYLQGTPSAALMQVKSQEKPAVCYLRVKENVLNTIGEETDRLEKAGFRHSNCYLQMQLNLKEASEVPRMGMPDHYIFKAEPDFKEIAQMRQLWTEFIPGTEFQSLSDAEIQKIIDSSRMIAILNTKQNCIAAAMFYENFLGKSLGRHIVVAADQRRMKLGSIVLEKWLEQISNQKITKAWSWVAESNTASLKMFELHGFRPTAMKMYQFMK